MSFLVGKDTRLIVQGITGREGTFHTIQMQKYGTKVVAGVRAGKGGTVVEGVPVYDTVRQAMEAQNANASVVFVPPQGMFEAALEAIEARVPLVVTIAEGVPVHDMMALYGMARSAGVTLIGPNSFGVISPGKSKAGFMAHSIFSEGPLGIMSRSATNCYETVFLLTRSGIGQSTVIGVGGDMIPGSTFVDMLPLFERDEQTRVIVMIGEIGGSEEELAAEYIRAQVTKPVIALIAGKSAPKGRSMGHAGAIVSPGGEGSAEKKEQALGAAGARIAESTFQIVEIAKDILKQTDRGGNR
jgi:succinyl-CoA synthetase alpha subunit